MACDFVCHALCWQDCVAGFARLFRVWDLSCVLVEVLAEGCKLVVDCVLSPNLASQHLELHPEPPEGFLGLILMVFQGQQNPNQLWNI